MSRAPGRPVTVAPFRAWRGSPAFRRSGRPSFDTTQAGPPVGSSRGRAYTSNMSLALAGPPRPFRRFEYDRMVELGFFDEERIELIDGMLVTMSPQSGRHATAVRRLNMMLVPALAGRA